MDAPPQPHNTNPDKRIEPRILSDLTFDDDLQNRTAPTSSHRMLSVTLLISVLAHGIILALAATAARQQAQQPERTVARPSIQIHFRQPPQTTTVSTEQPAEPEPAQAPIAETALPEEITTAEAIAPAETMATEPDTAPTETIAETPAPTPPRVQRPSLTDLRTAVQNRTEQDRLSRTTHPDCLSRVRRSAFLDCNDDDVYDFISAGQNDTVAFFTPTLPAEPENGSEERTSTGARVKAAIDMVDNQLGTTQTKKRIMNFP